MLALERAKHADAAKKIRAASVELLFRAPLFGLILLGDALKVEEKADIKTMATNGHVIYYAPDWVMKKPLASIVFDLLHELLHCFNNHVRRRGERDLKLYNYAADVRVAHDGLAIFRAKQPGFQLDADHIKALEWAEKLTVEQIYQELLEQEQRSKRESKFNNPKMPGPVPEDYEPDMVPDAGETPEQESEFRRQLNQDIAKAQIAEESQRRKTLEQIYGAAIAERVKELKRCDVPWNVLLQGRLVGELGSDTLSWIPPNRHWFPEIVLPSRRATRETELLLGIDVSGSITEDDLKRFRACVLPAAKRAKRTTIVTFDATIRELLSSARPADLLKELKFKMGSHSFTSTVELFEEVDRRKPSAVAILTDGYVRLPSRPHPRAHWLLTKDATPPPWGRVYHLRPSW